MAPIVRAVADSGVQIVYAEPLSRHPPGLNRHRGIGIKKAGSQTWEDLKNAIGRHDLILRRKMTLIDREQLQKISGR